MCKLEKTREILTLEEDVIDFVKVASYKMQINILFTYWKNILISRLYEQFSRNGRNFDYFRMSEKLSDS